MKTVLSLAIILLVGMPAFGQWTATRQKDFMVGAAYSQEYVPGGFVQVREWELPGDKMRLRELGMRSYPALQLKVEKRFQKNRKLALQYDHFFMRGRAVVNRNVAYNGTLISGEKGIDVSPTRYFRLRAIFENRLLSRPSFELWGLIGVVYDHVTFYLDGEVSPASPRDEVYEGFGRQAFPYPFTGINGSLKIDAKSNLAFGLSGTYVPKFKSFYQEGGSVFLQYSSIESHLHYTCRMRNLESNIGIRQRFMQLFQESNEDTNVLRTLTAGPYLGLNYHF